MIPQLIYLALLLAGMLLKAHQHGKPKEGNENFWTGFIAQAIIIWLLYAGGFFDVILNRFH